MVNLKKKKDIIKKISANVLMIQLAGTINMRVSHVELKKNIKDARAKKSVNQNNAIKHVSAVICCDNCYRSREHFETLFLFFPFEISVLNRINQSFGQTDAWLIGAARAYGSWRAGSSGSCQKPRDTRLRWCCSACRLFVIYSPRLDIISALDPGMQSWPARPAKSLALGNDHVKPQI